MKKIRRKTLSRGIAKLNCARHILHSCNRYTTINRNVFSIKFIHFEIFFEQIMRKRVAYFIIRFLTFFSGRKFYTYSCATKIDQ